MRHAVDLLLRAPWRVLPPAGFHRGVLACRRESTHCAKPCPHCNREVLSSRHGERSSSENVRTSPPLRRAWLAARSEGGCLSIRSFPAPLHARPHVEFPRHGPWSRAMGRWRSRTYENVETGYKKVMRER